MTKASLAPCRLGVEWSLHVVEAVLSAWRVRSNCAGGASATRSSTCAVDIWQFKCWDGNGAGHLGNGPTTA
jgi:hypothetical protein